MKINSSNPDPDCIESLLSRFLSPEIVESLAQDVVASVQNGDSAADMTRYLQNRLQSFGMQVSETYLQQWFERMLNFNCEQRMSASNTIHSLNETPHPAGISLKDRGLHPVLESKAHELIRLSTKAGLKVRLIQGWRSFEDQKRLYADRRRVTNASDGYSFHNYGLAFDLAFIDTDGRVSFADRHDWNKLGEIGKSLGLTWGGDFHSIKDLGHFEWHPNSSIHDIKSEFERGGMDAVWRRFNAWDSDLPDGRPAR